MEMVYLTVIDKPFTKPGFGNRRERERERVQGNAAHCRKKLLAKKLKKVRL